MENEVQSTTTPVQSPSPTDNPVSPSAKFSKIHIFATLGLLAITGAIFIGMKVGKNQNPVSQPTSTQLSPTPAPTPSTEPIPTTAQAVTWKIYNDPKNKVSFQYPSNAQILTREAIVEIEFDQDPSCPPNSGSNGCAWFVRIYLPIPNPDHKTLDEYIKEKFSDPTAEKYSVTNTKVAGLNAIDVKILTPGSSPAKMYYIQRANDILFMNVGVFGKISEYQEIVDKIVSTLSL